MKAYLTYQVGKLQVQRQFEYAINSRRAGKKDGNKLLVSNWVAKIWLPLLDKLKSF